MIPQLQNQLKNEETFEKVYKYTFGFAQEKGYKNVDIDLACSIWKLFFANRCKWLEKWCNFFTLKKTSGQITVVTRD